MRQIRLYLWEDTDSASSVPAKTELSYVITPTGFGFIPEKREWLVAEPVSVVKPISTIFTKRQLPSLGKELTNVCFAPSELLGENTSQSLPSLGLVWLSRYTNRIICDQNFGRYDCLDSKMGSRLHYHTKTGAIPKAASRYDKLEVSGLRLAGWQDD